MAGSFQKDQQWQPAHRSAIFCHPSNLNSIILRNINTFQIINSLSWWPQWRWIGQWINPRCKTRHLMCWYSWTDRIRSLAIIFIVRGAGITSSLLKKKVSQVISIHKSLYLKMCTTGSPQHGFRDCPGKNIARSVRYQMKKINNHWDDQSFLSKIKIIDKGALFICSTPLSSDYSDLSRNPETFCSDVI